MDEVKSYIKTDEDLEDLLIPVKRFGGDRGIKFGRENVQKSHLR